MCCFSETLTGVYFTELRGRTTYPTARAVVDSLLEDEVDHGRVGWASLEQRASDGSIEGLSQGLPAMADRPVGVAVRHARQHPEPDVPGLESLGHLGLDTSAALYQDALRNLIIPGLKSAGVDTVPLDSCWVHEASLEPLGATPADWLGVAVDLDADTSHVIVGASAAEAPSGALAGKAYVFARTASGWAERGCASLQAQTRKRHGDPGLPGRRNSKRLMMPARGPSPRERNVGSLQAVWSSRQPSSSMSDGWPELESARRWNPDSRLAAISSWPSPKQMRRCAASWTTLRSRTVPISSR